MLSTFIYKEKSWTCWMLSILQRKSWTCSGNVKVFLEFNDCVQLNQVRISMLHCEMLRYTARCYVPILIIKNNILKTRPLIG